MDNYYNVFLAVLISLVAWFLKKTYNQFQLSINNIQDLEKNLPKHYLLKEDFRDFKTQLFDRLDRIENKL